MNLKRDCLDVAFDLKHERGLTPVVLNMANRNTPGGGYKGGDGILSQIIIKYSLNIIN